MKTLQSQLVNVLRQEDSLTANGAITHSTSLDSCLDLFFIAGASRRMNPADILYQFQRAFNVNPTLAIQILFWARDCRGGAGEKKFFHVVATHLAKNEKNLWDKVSKLTPEYGTWKDYLTIENSNDHDALAHVIKSLHNSDTLLAKWFPRKGDWFNSLVRHTDSSPKLVRKWLVDLTRVVETKMCNKEWDLIKYEHVPSVAMNRYRNTFTKRDSDRFNSFNEAVLSGDTTVNASVLFPHELYQAVQRRENLTAVEAQWKSLPNYMEGCTDRILPVCDVSGSMTGLPMDVSVALGLYISERNEGIFKDAFMTFSESPEMCYVPGGTLSNRMNALSNASWGYNTDLHKTFKVLLNKAVKDAVPEDQMPNKLLIISDMEFDEACNGTNLDLIKSMYATHGYQLPNVIFWNVNGRVGNVPASCEDKGIGLVSGFSPAILKAILAGKDFTPVSLMLEAIDNVRYEPVKSALLK
jgi:hypothetical protein